MMKKLKFILKEMLYVSPFYTIVSICSSVLSGISAIIPALIVQQFIILLQGGIFNNHTILITIALIAIEFIFSFITQVLGKSHMSLGNLVSIKFSNDMKINIANKINKMEYKNFDDPVFHNSLNNALSQTGQASIQIITSFLGVITCYISIISLVILIVKISPIVLFPLLFSSLLIMFFKIKYENNYFKFIYGETSLIRKIDYYISILCDRNQIKEVRGFGLFQHLHDKIRSTSDRFYNDSKQMAKKEMCYVINTTVISRLSASIGLFLMIFTSFKNKIPVSGFSLYFISFLSLVSTINGSIDLTIMNYRSLKFLDFYFDFLDGEEKIDDENLKGIDNINNGHHVVEVKNLSFEYMNSNRKVLHNINLTFKTGETTLIVGQNGTGKTTLVKLLLGLYIPNGGSVSLDETDLNEIKTSSLCEFTSALFQDFNKYSLSIKESIALGDIRNLNDAHRITHAADLSGIGDHIDTFPTKYDTELTKLFNDDGVELSGGQWQKLALARVFFSNAHMLIFDEPTASLDAEAEFEIYKVLERVKKEKIVILISHRLSCAKLADKIIFMSEGQVLEQGTHDELMTLGGEYYRLQNLSKQDWEGVQGG